MPPERLPADLDSRATTLPSSDGHNELRKPLLQNQEHEEQHAVPSPRSPAHEPSSSLFGQLKRLVLLALPLAAQFMATLSLPVISNMSVGHLNDPLKLSSAMLGSSFFMVTGWSVLMALSTAQDTIVGQAHGAKNYALVGVTLQRGILVGWALCLPMITLWWNAAPVLLWLGLEPDIVQLTAHYLRLLSPTIFSVAVVANLQRWLVSQRVVHIASASVVAAASLAPVYNWLFIHRLGWGMVGAATAFYCAFTTYAVLMVILTIFHIRKLQGPAAQVWSGFSRQAFSNWSHYLSYGIPAAIMICCELWVVEAMLFMNGWLPNSKVSVAVMGLTQNLSSICSVSMASIGIACSTVIANSLGAGHTHVARTTFRAAACVAVIVQAHIIVPIYLLRDKVPLLFTHAPEVVELACHTLAVTVLSLAASGVTSVFSGALRGTGRQKWGALLNLTAYWVVGLPISVTLGLKHQLGPIGFWAGLAAANWTQMFIQAFLLFRLDWDNEVARARALVAAHASRRQQQQREPGSPAVPADHDRRFSVEETLVLAAEGAANAILDGAFVHTGSGLSAGASDISDDVEANLLIVDSQDDAGDAADKPDGAA